MTNCINYLGDQSIIQFNIDAKYKNYLLGNNMRGLFGIKVYQIVMAQFCVYNITISSHVYMILFYLFFLKQQILFFVTCCKVLRAVHKHQLDQFVSIILWDSQKHILDIKANPNESKQIMNYLYFAEQDISFLNVLIKSLVNG